MEYGKRPRLRGQTNPTLAEARRALRKAFKDTGRALWKAAEEKVSGSWSSRLEVNLDSINRITEEGGIVLVPGKLLGRGIVDHRVIVGALTASASARIKVERAGGEIMKIPEFVEKYSRERGIILVTG